MELNREMLNEEFESLLAIAKFTDNDFITSPFRKEYIEYALALINQLTEEVEDLKAIAEQYRKQFEEARADTVREFAERLKYTLCINNEENTEIFDYVFTLETIDQIAKEMIGQI